MRTHILAGLIITLALILQVEVLLGDPLPDAAAVIDVGECCSRAFEASVGGPAALMDRTEIGQVVSRVGQKLLRVSAHDSHSGLTWRFHVYLSDDIQAFSFPNGEVFISTGLLKTITRRSSSGWIEDEIAFVIGHELAHIQRHHYALRLRNHADINDIASQPSGVLLHLFEPPLGDKMESSMESEADHDALLMALQAGYSHQIILDYLRRLTSLGIGASFGRTHAPLANRAEALQAYYNESLLKAINDWTRASSYWAQGNYPEAADFFRRVQLAFPDLAVVCQSRGAVFLEWYSLTQNTQPLALRPAVSSALGVRGGTTGPATELLDQARQSFEDALRCDPEYLPAREGLGLCAIAKGDLQQAEGIFHGLQAEGVNTAALWTELGLVSHQKYLKAHEREPTLALQADSCYDRANHLDPMYWPALYNRARLNQSWKPQKAVAFWQKLLSLQVGPPWRDLAMGYLGIHATGPATKTGGDVASVPAPGITRYELVARWGQPQSAQGDCWTYASGFEVQLDVTESLIEAVNLHPGSGLRLHGLSIGETTADVLKALGNPSRLVSSFGSTEWLVFDRLGLAVFVRDKKIQELSLFARGS